MIPVVYVCKWDGNAAIKNDALYGDGVYYVSFSTLFFYAVQNKDSNCICSEVAMYFHISMLSSLVYRCFVWLSNLLERIPRVKRVLTLFCIMRNLSLLIFKVWCTLSSYSYLTTQHVWCCCFQLSITQHIHEAQNKYDSRMNTKILTRRLCVCSACCSVSFTYVSVFFCCKYNNNWDCKWVINLNESNIFPMVWVWCEHCTHTHCKLYL